MTTNDYNEVFDKGMKKAAAKYFLQLGTELATSDETSATILKCAGKKASTSSAAKPARAAAGERKPVAHGAGR